MTYIIGGHNISYKAVVALAGDLLAILIWKTSIDALNLLVMDGTKIPKQVSAGLKELQVTC